MLFTLVTPFMALLAAVQANVVTVHDSVTITEDLTETVTITNCGTKSCHPASYITYTSGSQEIVSCPTGGVPTSHGYSAPTVASEPVSETSTSTSTEYTRTRTHTRHHSRHSHSSSASAESVSSAPGFSATVTSAPCSSEETSVASHHPHVVSSSAEHSSNSASAPGSSAPCSSAPGSSRATAVASHSSHIAKSSAVNPGPSTSSHVVSSSAPGSSGASSDASPTSYVTSSSAVSSTFSAPASPSYVAPAHNTTSAEACITCHSSVPSDRSISVSTTTLCASAGCSPQNSTSRASYIASTGVSSGSYNTSSSGVKSASTSALYTTRSAEASSILPAASYNASSAIVSNGTSLASCTSCTVEVTPIPSVPQGTLSSESNQEVTAYVDVTATRYLNSSSAVLHSYVSSDIATRSLSQSIYSDRSNSSVSSIPSVSSYQGGASSMRAAGFGAVLGAALIAIM